MKNHGDPRGYFQKDNELDRVKQKMKVKENQNLYGEREIMLRKRKNGVITVHNG